MSNYKFNAAEFGELSQVYLDLEAFKEQLLPIIHSDISNELNSLLNNLGDVMEPNWIKLDKQLKKNNKGLEKIKKNNDLLSAWGVSEISAKKIFKKTPNKVTAVVYAGSKGLATITIKAKKLTWLELWKQADILIRDSEEENVVIEDFTYTIDGTYEIITNK